MKLTCLSAPGCAKPCLLVRWHGVSLLLDAGLDLSTSLAFLPLAPAHAAAAAATAPGGAPADQIVPRSFKDARDNLVEGELRESLLQNRVFVDSVPEFQAPATDLIDMSTVDAIVISNHGCMMALPFLTEGTGFKGRVFATGPTLTFGRLFMEETLEYIERTTKGQRAFKWKRSASSLPPPLCDVENPDAWRTFYTRQQIESCLSKVQLVGYKEKKDLFGLLQVSPASSGYCIGSANWIISSAFERIAYVSGSSTLTTHPRPMDQERKHAPLRNVDCLILSTLTQTPTHNPDPMIGEFCKTVAETLRGGGNVLVPCYPSGIVYDLFECLASQMEVHNMAGVPLFFISPVADSSLAYSNIMAEWLSSTKQNRVYMPEEPFPHGHLVRCARLKSFRALHDEGFSNDYRQPCVMFCGHPSLRFGDAVHFMELWGSNPNNTIVFTEPSFNYQLALAPFQPLLMKTVHCPIDTGLNFSQAKKLIRDLKPGCLVLPKMYTLPPASNPGRTDLTVEVEVPRYIFTSYETVQVPLKQRFESLKLDPSVASGLRLNEVRPGCALATITGKLSRRDNRLELSALEDRPAVRIPAKRKMSSANSSSKQASHSHPGDYLYGRLDANEFVRRVQIAGMLATVDDKSVPGVCIIELPNEEVIIQVDEGQTHVSCGKGGDRESEKVRNIIREAKL